MVVKYSLFLFSWHPERHKRKRMTYQQPFSRKNITIDILLIACFCSIYTYWFFLDLNKQGLYCDVALFGNAALSVKNHLPDYYGSVALNLFGKKIPLMMNNYIAATDIYATLPWVYLFGNKPIALNIPSFIYGFLSSILLYLLCLRIYHNRIYSALTSLMLVTYPPFIIAGRLGLFKRRILFITEEGSWIHFFSDFQRLVPKCNKHIELFREFQTPDDELMYVLYKVY